MSRVHVVVGCNGVAWREWVVNTEHPTTSPEAFEKEMNEWLMDECWELAEADEETGRVKYMSWQILGSGVEHVVTRADYEEYKKGSAITVDELLKDYGMWVGLSISDGLSSAAELSPKRYVEESLSDGVALDKPVVREFLREVMGSPSEERLDELVEGLFAQDEDDYVYIKVIPDPIYLRFPKGQGVTSDDVVDKLVDIDAGQIWRDAASYGNVLAETVTKQEAQNEGWYTEEEEEDEEA